jgi:hypothetical protein
VNAVRVGVPRGVEPVPAAMLTPLRFVEELIDEPAVGVRRFVIDERFDLGRVGGQPGQIEAEPAGQRAAIGLGRRSSSSFARTK